MGALALVLFRYGSTVSVDRLADKLKSDRDGSNPTAFLGTIRALAEAAGASPMDAGAGKLITIYNRHFPADSTYRLRDWK